MPRAAGGLRRLWRAKPRIPRGHVHAAHRRRRGGVFPARRGLSVCICRRTAGTQLCATGGGDRSALFTGEPRRGIQSRHHPIDDDRRLPLGRFAVSMARRYDSQPRMQSWWQAAVANLAWAIATRSRPLRGKAFPGWRMGGRFLGIVMTAAAAIATTMVLLDAR